MDVVQMLNAYWATAVPIVTEREGGLIERFAGDAILVVFNALEDQPDHALRAVRAARSMQLAVAEDLRRTTRTGRGSASASTPGRRRSATSAPARIGASRRSATPRTSRPPAGRGSAGGILIGQATYDAVRDEVPAEPFGDLDLKGKPARSRRSRCASTRPRRPRIRPCASARRAVKENADRAASARTAPRP
jgi:class 3 adenylate cyclase